MALGTVIRSFVPPDATPRGLTWDGRSLWLSGDTGNLIYQIDPNTGTVIRSFATPAASTRGLTWDGKTLWNCVAGGQIYQIDPVTGTVMRNFATPGAAPRGLTWDGKFLWHCDNGARLIYQIDPETGTVVRSFASPSNTPIGLAFDGHSLWNSDTGADRIYQVNPTTGTSIRNAVSPSAEPRGLTWDGRTLWNCDIGGAGTIYQISVTSTGAYYYVDATGGNDANNGESPSLAWQTIAKVNGETFSPGDRIHFKRGETWTGTALNVAWSGVHGRPITFATYDAGAKPIIDGNDAVNCIFVSGQGYLVFENLEVTQGLDAGFHFGTCHHIEVLECDAHEAGNDNLLFITGCYDCTVRGGEFYNSYQRVPGTNNAGIEIADGCHDILISDVECYNNVGGAGYSGLGITIHSHGATELPYNITIENSECYGNTDYGIFIWKQDNTADTDRNILIDGCSLHDNDMGIRIRKEAGALNYPDGITIDDCYSYDNTSYAYYYHGDNIIMQRSVMEGQAVCTECIDLDLYNNSFYFVGGNFQYPMYFSAARTDRVEVKNNIVSRTGTGEYQIGVDATVVSVNIDIDYNLYYLANEGVANTRWNWKGVIKNWANWLADSSQDANSPAADQDPLFVDPAAGDFHLQVGSPAIGAGTDLGFGTDLGAYQFGS